MGPVFADRALLIAMTAFFAVLALDITVPVLVLSVMALSRWLVLSDFSLAGSLRGPASGAVA